MNLNRLSVTKYAGISPSGLSLDEYSIGLVELSILHMIDQLIYSKTKWLMGRDLLKLNDSGFGQEFDLLIESDANSNHIIKVFESDLVSHSLEKTHLQLLTNSCTLLWLLRKNGYIPLVSQYLVNNLLDWKIFPFFKIRANLLENFKKLKSQ